MLPDPGRYEPCCVLVGLGNFQLPFAFSKQDGSDIVVHKNLTFVSVGAQITVENEPPWWHLVEKWWKANRPKGVANAGK